MCLSSLLSLVGCSIVKTDETKQNQAEVMKVGDSVLTKADVINSFYTYYQNNSSYFSYYDEEAIMESFYSWSVVKEIVNQKAKEALYNKETNPNGFIVFDEDDAKDVKEALFKYVYSQVSSYEKAEYGEDLDNLDYPVWLREEEEEEEVKEFKPYESSLPEDDDIKTHVKNDRDYKLTDDEIKALKTEIEQYLFEYVSIEAEDDDEEDVRVAITGEELEIRKVGYSKYIQGLVSNAKANGKDTNETTVFLEELVRVYNAYYDSQVSSLFQAYWSQNYLLNKNAVDIDGDGNIDFEKEMLSDKRIVKAYLEKYFTDMQLYQVEDSYIAALTGENGASLVLYNYKGKEYFFTVQHILVKYDDYMTSEVKKIPGYNSSGADYDEMIYNNYVAKRDELTNNYSMYTTINKDNIERFKTNNEIEIFGDYYYYDKEFEGESSKNFGYVSLVVSEEEGKTVYRRSDNNAVVDEADVKYLASENDVLNAYNTNLNNWIALANQYISNENDRETILEANSEIEYVLETALKISENGGTADDIKDKLASLLFVELQWIYSTDTLGNEYSNKLGYVVSNYPDENGSWVVDFAVGARKIMESIENGSSISELDTDNVVISDYGYHIIKVDNVFESGKSLVDMDKLTKEIDLEDEEFIAEMIDLLKQTYVCSASNQTMYEYFYDQLYTELVGSSSSAGTYFTEMQYTWLSEYVASGKIEYFTKLTYEELMNAIA